MQAIATKVLPMATYQPTRIKARHSGGAMSVTLSQKTCEVFASGAYWDDEKVHRACAQILLEKLGWEHLELVKGGALDDGYVFVPVARTEGATI